MSLLSPQNLVLVPVMLPLVGAIVAFAVQGLPAQVRSRVQVAVGGAVALGVLVSSFALWPLVAGEGVVRYTLAGWEAPVGIILQADGLAVFMLLMTAVVGAFGCAYAAGSFSGGESRVPFRVEDSLDPRGAFWPLWMFLWGALNGLFLSGDAFNLYVTLELLGLSAAALISLTGTGTALAAGMRYLLVSLLGSLAYLLGVALLYGSFGALDLATLREVVSPSGPVCGRRPDLLGHGAEDRALPASLLDPLGLRERSFGGERAPCGACRQGVVLSAPQALVRRVRRPGPGSFGTAPRGARGGGYFVGGVHGDAPAPPEDASRLLLGLAGRIPVPCLRARGRNNFV